MTGSTACGCGVVPFTGCGTHGDQHSGCRTNEKRWQNEVNQLNMRGLGLCVENNRLHTESLARLLEIERLDGVIERLRTMVFWHETGCHIKTVAFMLLLWFGFGFLLGLRS